MFTVEECERFIKWIDVKIKELEAAGVSKLMIQDYQMLRLDMVLEMKKAKINEIIGK